jgi:hypothetical protein
MMYTPLVLLASAVVARASITQDDFKGKGHIFVLQTEDWQTVNPSQSTVGCLNDHGKFINSADASKCGTFIKEAEYPYQIYTSVGNCTFYDNKQVTNTDSAYGGFSWAYTCEPGYVGTISDDLYTIVRPTPYIFTHH